MMMFTIKDSYVKMVSNDPIRFKEIPPQGAYPAVCDPVRS
jgi:hypothetical protein